MAKYRNQLPQLTGDLFLLDGGIETFMIFHEHLDLPSFAAFHLLATEQGRNTLERYFHRYCQIAQMNQAGLILETITWRASSDWAAKIGYSSQELAEKVRQSVEMFLPLREQYENEYTRLVISGCMGPRGDGYVPPENRMTEQQAREYHATQIETFYTTEVDFICALTLNYVEEAIGITQAAHERNMPVVISFTTETDGRLPSGQRLQDAIEQVDEVTHEAPAYYMINCAHPTHFEDAIKDEHWTQRIQGLRANASRLSHAELDEAQELDDGDPVELGLQYHKLRQRLPRLNVLGGCCGTDHRHIEQIAHACRD